MSLPQEPGARYRHGSDLRHHHCPSTFSQYYPEEPQTPHSHNNDNTTPRIESYDEDLAPLKSPPASDESNDLSCVTIKSISGSPTCPPHEDERLVFTKQIGVDDSAVLDILQVRDSIMPTGNPPSLSPQQNQLSTSLIPMILTTQCATECCPLGLSPSKPTPRFDEFPYRIPHQFSVLISMTQTVRHTHHIKQACGTDDWISDMELVALKTKITKSLPQLLREVPIIRPECLLLHFPPNCSTNTCSHTTIVLSSCSSDIKHRSTTLHSTAIAKDASWGRDWGMGDDDEPCVSNGAAKTMATAVTLFRRISQSDGDRACHLDATISNALPSAETQNIGCARDAASATAIIQTLRELKKGAKQRPLQRSSRPLHQATKDSYHASRGLTVSDTENTTVLAGDDTGNDGRYGMIYQREYEIIQRPQDLDPIPGPSPSATLPPVGDVDKSVKMQIPPSISTRSSSHASYTPSYTPFSASAPPIHNNGNALGSNPTFHFGASTPKQNGKVNGEKPRDWVPAALATVYHAVNPHVTSWSTLLPGTLDFFHDETPKPVTLRDYNHCVRMRDGFRTKTATATRATMTDVREKRLYRRAIASGPGVRIVKQRRDVSLTGLACGQRGLQKQTENDLAIKILTSTVNQRSTNPPRYEIKFKAGIQNDNAKEKEKQQRYKDGIFFEDQLICTFPILGEHIRPSSASTRAVGHGFFVRCPSPSKLQLPPTLELEMEMKRNASSSSVPIANRLQPSPTLDLHTNMTRDSSSDSNLSPTFRISRWSREQIAQAARNIVPEDKPRPQCLSNRRRLCPTAKSCFANSQHPNRMFRSLISNTLDRPKRISSAKGATRILMVKPIVQALIVVISTDPSPSLKPNLPRTAAAQLSSAALVSPLQNQIVM